MSVAFVFGILLPSLLWKLDEARREPANRAAWIFVVAFSCFTTSFVLAAIAKTPAAAQLVALDPRLLQATLNVTNIGIFTALQVFYLQFIKADVRPGRVRFEMALAAVVLAAMTALTVFGDALGGNYRLPDAAYVRTPQVAAFFTLHAGYTAYVLTMLIGWTARYLRRLPGPALRTAVGVAGVGAVMLWVAATLRLLLTLVAVSGGSYPPEIFPLVLRNLVVIGGPLLIGGLAFPVVTWRLAAAHRWVRDLRTFHRLGPLWREVRVAYPELIRPSTPTPDQPGPRSAARTPLRLSLQARIVQCRDGCSRAGRLLDDAPPGADDAAHRIAAGIARADQRHPDRPGDDLPRLVAISSNLQERPVATAVRP